jgi:hypothetical protein
MNDLVFIMCNLKLNDNQVKKQGDDFGVVDDISSDDDWITEGEKHDGSSNFDLLDVIDSATRRKNGKVMKKKFLMMLKWRVMVLKMIWRFKLMTI